MEQVRFNYSMKNIPIPSKNSYIKNLIEKTESFIKRMRWKAYHYDKQHAATVTNNSLGFKTRKCPPQNENMKSFESDLLRMIKNVEFQNVKDPFQKQLKDDINLINASPKAFIPADKTTNFYKLDEQQYKKLLHDSITTSYQKADETAFDTINNEAKHIATKLNIDDRMECMAKKQSFITIKDHKPNFQQNPTCRLINPAKTELGLISKQIVERINNEIRRKTQLNQWKNSKSVIEWFNNIPNKSKYTFITFDIDNFYPSISEELLHQAIEHAKQFANITQEDTDIILHTRKSLLFHNNTPWVKKGNSMFDVTMGSFDGAEICELVGLYILSLLSKNHANGSIGLYRDDGLAAFYNISGPQADKIRKDITKCFNQHSLKISIACNLKIVNFLDVTFNLANGTYKPYRKPNDRPLYVNARSNHPPTIIKRVADNINHRLNDISCNEEVFNEAKPCYEEALQTSGHTKKLLFSKENKTRSKNRKRNIIWYNPPYNKSTKTNIGREFLNLVDKHFPPGNKHHQIFNKNNIKVSYGCCQNMESILRQHNNKVLNDHNVTSERGKACNCNVKDKCPLDNNCQDSSVVYNANVSTDDDPTGKNYIGLTEGTFKLRFDQHTSSFKHEKNANRTKLSKHIWELKNKGKQYNIKWSILNKANAYSNKSKRCNLCITEKFCILNTKNNSLNKKDELISKCRHENKFYIKNYKNEIT